MASSIESVIVLMMENRSFDHMLGFLPHPDPRFDGLTGIESNPAPEPSEPPVTVSPTARPTLALDPAHNHDDVLLQLTGRRAPTAPFLLNNSGFVVSFEGVGLKEKGQRGFGPLIMKCQPPGNVPVLSALAQGFAVCTRWFSSVPGQTWPNRNFAHAGTSDGEVDNARRLFTNPTLFERLEEEGQPWRIYHEGAAQSWAFRKLWFNPSGSGFRSHGELLQDIAADQLPRYAFVEPDHFPPGSSSQHPSNNEKRGDDFARGEALIRDIYNALKANMAVFEKTLLVITYDEHGGFFDRTPPPSGPEFKDGKVAPGGFAFDLLGVRVPAVLVSPFIPVGSIDDQIYDHSSIVATVRKLFAPATEPVPGREARAATFEHNLSLAVARTAAQLPSLPMPIVSFAATAEMTLDEFPDQTQLDDFQQSLVWLTDKVAAELHEREASLPPAPMSAAAAIQIEEVSPLGVLPLLAKQEHVSRLLRRGPVELSGASLDPLTPQSLGPTSIPPLER